MDARRSNASRYKAKSNASPNHVLSQVKKIREAGAHHCKLSRALALAVARARLTDFHDL